MQFAPERIDVENKEVAGIIRRIEVHSLAKGNLESKRPHKRDLSRILVDRRQPVLGIIDAPELTVVVGT